ncbi:Holliday junction branch migration protein RuvA [Pectinatus brassicae]|uniref:Holliday junction branch migration complex subunit RuvA n=1 Tax=Pectinatus brassicae TaxID=862415 RepID=A0A840UQL5_9FIRM|nr:Holliday junction branch migration protein RuvA [Pectinatus brassicae]MBB5336462.1 Holliday junction DNA helicase RuvA [Pectinatus brassicae]
MIGYLHGKITELFSDACFIDVNGVGYRVLIAASTRSQLNIGSEITIYTYLNVREDALQLYGFSNQNEYDIFNQLISVSGIGPKAALSILSSMNTDKIIWAVQNKQPSLLTAAPGIGKKTAERIILELKDKFTAITNDTGIFAPVDMPAADSLPDIWSDAKKALISLGYTPQETAVVLKKAHNLTSVEEIIKFALKELSM